MTEAERIIAILVDRLGGDVTIDAAQLEYSDLELLAAKDPARFSYIFRTRHVVEGETVDEQHPTQADLDRIVSDHRQALEAGYAAVSAAVSKPFDAIRVD